MNITYETLCEIRADVCSTFLEVEDRQTKLNKVGSKSRDFEGDELLVYLHILDEITQPPHTEFLDDTYPSLLTNKDIYRIHKRALEIRSSTL